MNWDIIGSGDGSFSGRRQTTFGTNADLLSIEPVVINFSEIEITNYLSAKMQFIPDLEIVTSIGGESWHGQAQNGVNFDFEVDIFDLEGQGQSPKKQ